MLYYFHHYFMTTISFQQIKCDNCHIINNVINTAKSMQPITKVPESPTTGLKIQNISMCVRVCICVCVCTYHPCIIREATAAIKEILKELMKKMGTNSVTCAASYFTTSRTPELIYMGCTPHQNSTQSENPP